MAHNTRWCPSIRAKSLSRQTSSGRCLSTAVFAREVEDQDSGNLTVNHSAVEDRSTNHRFGLNIDHDSAMRTSRPVRDARAPNQFMSSIIEEHPANSRSPSTSLRAGFRCAQDDKVVVSGAAWPQGKSPPKRSLDGAPSGIGAGVRPAHLSCNFAASTVSRRSLYRCRPCLRGLCTCNSRS